MIDPHGIVRFSISPVRRVPPESHTPHTIAKAPRSLIRHPVHGPEVFNMANPTSNVDFCTLGMFIIDEIEFAPPKPPVKDIVGGAGSYSALGARIFSPSPESRSVGWFVDCGSDFPDELRDYIASWDSGALIRETPDRLTTRGWNGYGENEHRGTYSRRRSRRRI